MNTEYASYEETKEDLNLRENLIRLSAEKEIKHTEAYLKKASMGTLEKIKQDYDRKQQDKVNNLLTETLITKFSVLIKEFDMIENDKKLDKELSENKMFCDDVKSLVTKISPYIPMIGLLTGALIIAKHVWDKPSNKCPKDGGKNSDENVPNSTVDDSNNVGVDTS